MEHWNQFMCAFVLSWQCVLGSVSVGPTVDSGAGKIRGISAFYGNYSMFLGIPYAKLNMSNPFGHSKPHPQFEGVFEAYDDSTVCPQVNYMDLNVVDGSLNCLILNVYVPNIAFKKNKLPVMVWLYDGGFYRGFMGRNAVRARYLMRNNIIVVTISYRLGPYGFMCLDIPEVPGNQGLKDQVLALKWIKNNIESFGGDPKQITLFGLSSGAISIDFHLLSTDDDLFHRVILQSGSSLASTVIKIPDIKAPLKISEYLGMPPTNSLTEAISFLATVNEQTVVEAGIKLNMLFKPCIEKKFDGVEPFITESWINIKKPNVKGKEVMFGVAEYEKAYEFMIAPDKYITSMDIFRESLLNTFNFSDRTLIKMRNLIKQFYLGDKAISKDNQIPLINFLSDFTYVHPTHRTLERYLNGGAKQIYHYMFSYVGERNYYQKFLNITFNGAVHGDELGYIFDHKIFSRNPTPEDQLTIDRITAIWANFAKYGNPTPEKTNLLPVKWMPVSKEHHYFLKIGSNITLEDSLFHRRMAFWDLFYTLNEKSQKLYADVDKSTDDN